MTMPIGQNRTWRAVSSPSPRLPSGRLRESPAKTGVNALMSATGYGEGRGEGASHTLRLAETPPHPDLLPASGEKETAVRLGHVRNMRQSTTTFQYNTIACDYWMPRIRGA